MSTGRRGVVQNRDELNIYADPGVAVCEVPTLSGSPANILLLHEKNWSGTFVAARYNELLSLMARMTPQGNRTTAC